MKGTEHRSILLLAVAMLAAGGCSREPAAPVAEHEHHEDGADESGVGFKEGEGLALSPEVLRALDLKTAPVARHPLADNVRLMAQVFAVSPRVLASATVPASDARHFTRHAFKDAQLVRIDRGAANAARLVDLVVALERVPAPAIGDFVELGFATDPAPVPAVPRSAVLDAATGSFVYRVNDGRFLRTAVKTGARSEDFVEITEGIPLDAVVVASSVEQLWLAELRLTKGGGHSH